MMFPRTRGVAATMSGGIDNKNVFDIDFVTGDLSQFDSTVDPGNLTVDVAGAMGGTAIGLSVLVDSTDPAYGQKNITSPSSGILRFRYYLDPNNLTMGGGDEFSLSKWYDTSGSFLYGWNMVLKPGSDYVLATHWCIDGGYGGQQAGGNISDAAHYIELQLTQSSSAIASDGRLDWWVDGAVQTAVTSIDNFDLWDTLDALLMGATSDLDAGTSGTFFMDEIAGNDNGVLIGA